MERLYWIGFGKLLCLKITTKNKKDDDTIELNFEYSNNESC